jgi:hypothetical protein
MRRASQVQGSAFWQDCKLRVSRFRSDRVVSLVLPDHWLSNDTTRRTGETCDMLRPQRIECVSFPGEVEPTSSIVGFRSVEDQHCYVSSEEECVLSRFILTKPVMTIFR